MTPVETSVKEKLNPLKALTEFGQSIWLDYIRRSLITSGELRNMIREDDLRGITSNPAIFEKAIAGSTDYVEALKEAEQKTGQDAMAIYEELAIRDIQDAADALKPVYEKTQYRDGYVSLEVSPYLARETQASIEEARRLWKTLGRANVMIKIPATKEGIPAIRQLISEGINVNVTLLFSQEVYEEVVEAYLSGLEKLAGQGNGLARVASVASFFVSRIDTAMNELLSVVPSLQDLSGKVAIANAKLAYARYSKLFSGPRWQALAKQGAQTQRLLWASTGTKNPNYRDVLYIEELIGPDTVNTIPPATLEAFRDHGKPRVSLNENLGAAQETLRKLDEFGISLKDVTDRLLVDGLRLFVDAFDKLLNAIDKTCKAPRGALNRQRVVLPKDLGEAVKSALEDWRLKGKVRRLWRSDSSLWTGSDERKWLGWLGVTEDQLAHLQNLTGIADEVRKSGFSNVVLLGMGGSSLAPEVMKLTFGKVSGFPELHILDSTDPAQIQRLEKELDIANALFIVSSKSGSTLEPNIFQQYFFKRVQEVVGAEKAGSRFIAITDPGSKMQEVAEKNGFRRIFFGWSSIGGRYSALSNFGMVPAAMMGVDIARFLDRAEEMVHACSSCVPVEENPGVVLGALLGVLANRKRDKVTLVTSPGLRDLGAWLEQLLAESTGKDGKGIIPVDRESLGPPEVYGNDRLFAYIRLESGSDPSQDKAVDALEGAGHPVVRISVSDPYDLGQEFFRWEIATAVAGSIIGINAFNQPDVEASKVVTRELTAAYEKSGSLPLESPFWEGSGVKLFSDDKNIKVLDGVVGSQRSLASYLKAHLHGLAAGDYFALLAYLEMNETHERSLQLMRHLVRDRKHVATCLGFGPRFLHSTGQAYKGGPNTGVFLQVTCDDALDLAIPGQKYTFGVVKAAQARGDFQVLAARNRRALRIHLPKDVEAGLATLRSAIEQALA